MRTNRLEKPSQSRLSLRERAPFRGRSFILVAGLLSAATASADNWPQWRGAANDGISHETDLPEKWSKTENIAWRLPLPGPAGATPIVWEDSIFVTSATPAGDLLLICVGTDGSERWRQTVTSGDKAVRGDEGNSASPSPVTDGEHVWAFFANGVLGCYDFAGKEVWKEDLQTVFGKFDIAFGMTSTPVLDGDRLYLQLLHSKAALVVALDKTTGKEIWRHERKSDAHSECEHSYASPMLYRDDKREFLLTHGCDYVVAHSLDDGRELWRCGGLNPKGNYNPTLRFVASPVAVPGLIVVPSAKNGPVLGLRPDSMGDISDSSKAHRWVRPQNTPDVPSPLVVDGLVYLCRENGLLICMDAKTGKEIYQERAYSDRYRASPIYADGKIYLTARGGVITVVKAGPKFEILASNDMQEPISSSLAVSNGRIYVRTFEALYAVGK